MQLDAGLLLVRRLYVDLLLENTEYMSRCESVGYGFGNRKIGILLLKVE